jgi:hypothetical protein
LQPAGSVFGAIGAVEVMVAEKKLKCGIPEPFDFRGVQVHRHAVSDRLGAGSNRGASAFDFYKAKTAGSKRRGGFSNSA